MEMAGHEDGVGKEPHVNAKTCAHFVLLQHPAHIPPRLAVLEDRHASLVCPYHYLGYTPTPNGQSGTRTQCTKTVTQPQVVCRWLVSWSWNTLRACMACSAMISPAQCHTHLWIHLLAKSVCRMSCDARRRFWRF